MSFAVQFRPEAETDLFEAAEWYEIQSPDLGTSFLNEILITCETISEHPKLYTEIYRDIRRAVIQKFPFSIYYRIHNNRILIYAVMHGSRNPTRWKQRTYKQSQSDA